MLKKDFEIIFNCVDEFHPNPAVKNKNIIRQCFNGVLLSQSRVTGCPGEARMPRGGEDA